jgi:prepilin-type N-terminal cleavage/methylation domain-containing protein
MKWKKNGYTLIEILVALTIIGLLFSFGYVSFRDFSRRQALSGLTKQIQGDLRLAQQMALSGQKPNELGCRTNTLVGIRFGLTTVSPFVYRIRAVCGTEENNYPIIKEFYLPNDVSPAPVTFLPNPIIFKVLGQGTNIPLNENVVITLTQIATNNTATITITSGGEIR